MDKVQKNTDFSLLCRANGRLKKDVIDGLLKSQSGCIDVFLKFNVKIKVIYSIMIEQQVIPTNISYTVFKSWIKKNRVNDSVNITDGDLQFTKNLFLNSKSIFNKSQKLRPCLKIMFFSFFKKNIEYCLKNKIELNILYYALDKEEKISHLVSLHNFKKYIYENKQLFMG